MQHDYICKEPRILQSVTSTFGNDICSIHAGDHISSASVGTDQKDFYVWGGKTMIETAALSSTIRGSETAHGSSAHSRGGSQNTAGIVLLDTLTEFSEPYLLSVAYENIAII